MSKKIKELAEEIKEICKQLKLLDVQKEKLNKKLMKRVSALSKEPTLTEVKDEYIKNK